MVGFTFVWIDKLRTKAFYGCKWGTVEEADRSGYVGFNNALLMTYKSRPPTFERRILGIHQTRTEMYEALQSLLDGIPDRLLGRRYYNTSKTVSKPWRYWSPEEQAKVKNKIAETQRRNLQYEDIRERYAELVWPNAGRKPKPK
jgi:hypothetical protein